MCGRFALGLPPAEIRLGVADHFPRLLRNPAARAARARHGEEGRARQRQDRQRRLERGNAAAERRDVVEQEPEQQQEDDEELEWPPSDQDNLLTTSNNPESETSAASVEAAAARLRWENEERFRIGNYNVAPRSNGVVLRLRPRSQDRQRDVQEGGSDLRLRGGGGGGESAAVEKREENPVVIEEKILDIGDQELVIETMQWGLIPHWSKHPPSGALNTINARSEALIDNAGGMWQSLKGPKRCLVVVEGYYEWQKKSGAKIPHFTKLPPTASTKPHLMLLAGLYDTVKYIDSDPASPPVKTFTILTTTPSKSLGWLHDRMPCVLESEEECVRWLDCRNGWTGEVARLLRPYEGEVECYPVPTEVGKVGTNSPSFVVPVKERKDGIANFFKKQTATAVPSLSEKSKKVELDTASVKLEQGKRSRKEEDFDAHQPADDSRPGKKMKMKMDLDAADAKVHSPVPSDTIIISSQDKRKADAKLKPSIADDKRSMKQEAKEEEFEMQIGDDSNAPNHIGGSERKGKGRPVARRDAKPIAGSKRQTRSSAHTDQVHEKPATRSTRSGKQSTSANEDKKDLDDEIEILSSPDTKPSKATKAATSFASAAPGKQTQSPQRKTAKKGGKQAKGTVQATTEDGAENTHQMRLDGFLKHEE